jgi:hypothetical protein
MSAVVLQAMRDLIQEDVGNRGLRTDPEANLITAYPGDFEAACRSLAETPNAGLAIVTGFLIPHAQPPSGETDGPLGALFLARSLVPLGVRVALVTDPFCRRALSIGLEACGLGATVPLITLPPPGHPWEVYLQLDWRKSFQGHFPLTHLLAVERVGPNHTTESLRRQTGTRTEELAQFEQEVPLNRRERCYSLRGRDLTAYMCPAHLLFEAAKRQVPRLTTIGIGDGGNEIGMGKIPWAVIKRNIPNGGLIACRVPTDYLIVCGLSNWGAYGMGTGVRYLRGAAPDHELFDVGREQELLRLMVDCGPLVDGVSGRREATVDGLAFHAYVQILSRLAALSESGLRPGGSE